MQVPPLLELLLVVWVELEVLTSPMLLELEVGTSPRLEVGTSLLLEGATSPLLEVGASPLLEVGASPLLGGWALLEVGASPLLAGTGWALALVTQPPDEEPPNGPVGWPTSPGQATPLVGSITRDALAPPELAPPSGVPWSTGAMTVVAGTCCSPVGAHDARPAMDRAAVAIQQPNSGREEGTDMGAPVLFGGQTGPSKSAWMWLLWVLLCCLLMAGRHRGQRQ